MCDPILVTLIKMRPHNSQSSGERGKNVLCMPPRPSIREAFSRDKVDSLHEYYLPLRSTKEKFTLSFAFHRKEKKWLGSIQNIQRRLHDYKCSALKMNHENTNFSVLFENVYMF